MSEYERTDAEREAARRAREAARQGRAPGPAPGAAPVPPPAPVRPPRAPVLEPLPDTERPVVVRQPRAPRTTRPSRQPRATRPPREPRAPRTRVVGDRPGRGIGRWIAAGAVIAVVVVALWFVISLFQPFGGKGSGRVRVTIPAQSSTASVGDLLARDGVVSSSFFFKLRAELDGVQLKAGDYVFAHGMSYGAAIAVLKSGPHAPPYVNVTIIPGKSRFQLDRLLRSQGVAGSYLRDTVRSPGLNPRSYGAPAGTPSLEGFLYPDTYNLRHPISIPALVADQLAEFKSKMALVNLGEAKRLHLTAYDVVKIASLEDAEAALPGDLAKVASVIDNRLRLGMTLGLDTTAAYAANNYTGNLTDAQLNSHSPWNTLNHPGLPPTPIDSPDLAALQAAAHPAHTPYLYFIVKVCGNGALAFTQSYSAFLVLSRQYNDALRARGLQKAEFCGHHGH